MSKRVPNWDAMPIDEVVEMSRQFAAVGMGDIPGPRLAQLVAEIDRLRTQRAAALKLADEAEHNCTRWEDPLPVPEWVGRLRKALDGGT